MVYIGILENQIRGHELRSWSLCHWDDNIFKVLCTFSNVLFILFMSDYKYLQRFLRYGNIITVYFPMQDKSTFFRKFVYVLASHIFSFTLAFLMHKNCLNFNLCKKVATSPQDITNLFCTNNIFPVHFLWYTWLPFINCLNIFDEIAFFAMHFVC